MRLIWALASALAIVAGPCAAQNAYVSNEGHQYAYALNANGAVLTSLYPVARFFDRGASSYVETGIEVIYLGRNCDAFSQHLGNGRWSWANGGFWVQFDAHRIAFPRQEIEANNGLGCGA